MSKQRVKECVVAIVAVAIGLQMFVVLFNAFQQPKCDNPTVISIFEQNMKENNLLVDYDLIYEISSSLEESGYVSPEIPSKARVCHMRIQSEEEVGRLIYGVWKEDGKIHSSSIDVIVE